MATKYWFVKKSDRTKVSDWGAAVVSGIAQFDITEIIQEDSGTPRELQFAIEDQTVSDFQVARATANQNAGSVPTKIGNEVSTVGKPKLTATAAAAPAGGTGAAAGGWDTAPNRDAAIATINNLRTRVNELEAALKKVGILS